MKSDESLPLLESFDRAKGICTYLAFMVFGSGSAWIVISALYMELPIYQNRFGLVTSNRMAIGYNLGALTVPVFLAARSVISWYGYKLNYPLVISIMACVNLWGLLMASQGINTVSGLIFVSFLGGSCGYLAFPIHQTYLVQNYHNVYAAAFSTGDSATSVFASVLGILQRPELQAKNGRRFAPDIFYLAMLPFVVLAYVAFLGIHRSGLGALPACIDSGNVLPEEVVRLTDGSVQKVPEDTKDMRWYTLSRPYLAFGLGVLGFALSVTCWGVGDSFIPFACAQASCADDGRACVFQSSISTNCALLLGPFLASLPSKPTRSMLYLPAVLYTICFLMLLAAVSYGGAWAQLWNTMGSVESCGSFVVAVVFMLRLAFAFLNVIRLRLVQVEFLPNEWENIVSLFSIVSVAANFIGVFASTYALREV